MNEAFDQAWWAVSEEILADVNQWRATHPKATFQELEQAFRERISRLEAQALQEAALAQAASDWSQAPERDLPVALLVAPRSVRKGYPGLSSLSCAWKGDISHSTGVLAQRRS
jgi:hypothetical protein